MSLSVCFGSNTLGYPQGGGYLWNFLNWAVGLGRCGCDVAWLEPVPDHWPDDEVRRLLAALRRHLGPYGLADSVVLYGADMRARPADLPWLAPDAAAQADLLLSLNLSLPPGLERLFRRSALVDTDPGLMQHWIGTGQVRLPDYDLHFTTGENVAPLRSPAHAADIAWIHTPHCVATDLWPVRAAAPDRAYSTVTHWLMDQWVTDGDAYYANDKRTGFLPYLDLPRHTDTRLELAVCLGDDDAERRRLEALGWSVRESWDLTATPWDYQAYIQASRGEFSCVKPSYVRHGNAWTSDRTLAYLASGKPAVVQHTGSSAFLPDAEGLFRFRTPAEAAAMLAAAEADYDRHARAARALTEAHFDAGKVVAAVLERALP